MDSGTIIQRLTACTRPLTAPQLAEFLGVRPITVYRQAARGAIPSFRIGYAVRFDGREIARWLDAGQKKERVN